MKSLLADAVSGLLFMTAFCGAGEIFCQAITALSGCPEPLVHTTLVLVMLALTGPVIVSLFSTDPMLRYLVLPPALVVAIAPLLIERAHHVAGFGFWERQLPFESLPLYGHMLVIIPVVALLAALPASRAWHLNR